MEQITELDSKQSGKRPLIVYRAFFTAAQLLEVPAKELPEITGLSQPTLSRLKNAAAEESNREVNPKSYESILLFLRMYRSLDSIFGGNIHNCKTWLNSNHKTIGGKPVEFLRTTEGLVRIVSYLDAMRAKV